VCMTKLISCPFSMRTDADTSRGPRIDSRLVGRINKVLVNFFDNLTAVVLRVQEDLKIVIMRLVWEVGSKKVGYSITEAQHGRI
jgi:hypothetical protein